MPYRELAFVGTVVLAAVTVAADYCLKRASQQPHCVNYWFLAAVVLYVLPLFGWVYAFRYLTFAELGAVSCVSVILFMAFTGVAFFGETLRWTEVAGVALAVASIALLYRSA